MAMNIKMNGLIEQFVWCFIKFQQVVQIYKVWFSTFSISKDFMLM